MSKLKIITIFAITTILANAAAINDIEKGEGMGIPIGKGSYAEVNSVAIGKQSKANVANSITIGDDSKTEYKNNDSGIAYDKLKKIYVKKEEIKVFNDKEFMEKLKIDHAQHLKNGVMEYDKINSLAYDIQEYAQNKLASKEEKDESKKKEYEKKANEHLENLKNHHFTFLLTNEEKGKVTEEKLKKILDNMIKPNRKNPGENIMYKVLKRADKVIEKYKEYKIHEKALSNLTDDKIKEDLLKDYYLKDDKYYLKIRNVVVGDNASGIGRNLTAIGGNAVSHDFGTSVGYNSKSIGANSVAVGSNATALTLDSVVIGSNAISKDENMENGVTREELEIMYKNKILHERLKDYEEKAKKHDPFDAFIRDTYEGDARNDYKWYKENDAPISKQYTEEEFVKQYVYFKRLERFANQIYYDPLVKKQIEKILESEYEVREIETENGKVKKYYRKKLNDDSKSKLNTVIGYDSQSVGSKNVAIGATTKVYDSSIGIGYMAQSFDKGIAIGLKSITNAENSISIGNNTQNYGSDSVLIGSSSHNIAKDGIVIGKDSGAVSDNSVVIGKNSFSYHRKQWVNANTIVTKEEAKKQIKKEIESVINSIIRMEKSSYDIETEYTLFAKELYARYPNDT